MDVIIIICKHCHQEIHPEGESMGRTVWVETNPPFDRQDSVCNEDWEWVPYGTHEPENFSD